MSSVRDYYQVLEVERAASQEEIKRAYRKLARQYHPDVSQEPDAEARFKEINEAYQVLSDPQKRSTYDRFGRVRPGMGSSRDFGFRNPFDIFEEVFGAAAGFRTQSRHGPRRGADIQHTLDLTFEEAVFGVEREIEIMRHDVCPVCQGSRAELGTSPTRCSECNGTGQVRRVQRSLLGSFVSVANCPVCGGTGETIPVPCSECEGRGQVYVARQISVKIPPGVDDGTQIRLSGEGEPGERGGPPGNLYVALDVEPHPIFQRRGDDVLVELQVNVAQATLGAEVDVPTLEGEETISIGPGTQNGTVLRLRGQGVPHLRRNGRGDQHVLVRVAIPRQLTREQRQLFKALGETLDPETVWEEKHGLLDELREFLGL